MKGGRVNFLKQVDVVPVWQTNNFTDSAPDGMLIEGKQILNNLISDLKTTQFGGIINERMMDKDSYYNEYKNYKLRYLAMKNK
jgi:Holliday junction resolvasome RuvABC endonuclease subunit